MKVTNNNNIQQLYSKQSEPKLSQAKGKGGEGTKTSSNVSDSFQLSSSAQRFDKIKERIEEGYYDKPEVLEKLAEKLDKIIELTEKKESN
ncbi:MAG: hypothetical protein Kapaf2KO_00560 [Candidatus Kapaibacteriales bacterium]